MAGETCYVCKEELKDWHINGNDWITPPQDSDDPASFPCHRKCIPKDQRSRTRKCDNCPKIINLDTQWLYQSGEGCGVWDLVCQDCLIKRARVIDIDEELEERGEEVDWAK